MSRSLNIGLFGFGTVGEGAFQVLQDSQYKESIKVKRICIKDESKSRSLPDDFFTTDKYKILQDPDIDLIVEVIDDADEGFLIVSEALKNGKNVVTANKKMVAENLEALYDLQQEHGKYLRYEAAACGAIPIVNTIDGYYGKESIDSINGIFNGSSNYILTKMDQEEEDYHEALKKAQELGFAELDPTLDVDGWDQLYKTLIFAAHGYGCLIEPKNVLLTGISNLALDDVQYARKNNQRIRLRSNIQRTKEGRIAVYVTPHLVPEDDILYRVNGEDNAVIVNAYHSGQGAFIGKGAGGSPTGSAVVSDIVAINKGYHYDLSKHQRALGISLDEDVLLRLYLRGGDQELIDRIGPEKVVEEGDDHSIIEAKLSALKNAQEAIKKAGAFIATVDDPASYLQEAFVEEAQASTE